MPAACLRCASRCHGAGLTPRPEPAGSGRRVLGRATQDSTIPSSPGSASKASASQGLRAAPAIQAKAEPGLLPGRGAAPASAPARRAAPPQREGRQARAAAGVTLLRCPWRRAAVRGARQKEGRRGRPPAPRQNGSPGPRTQARAGTCGDTFLSSTPYAARTHPHDASI